MAFRTTLICLVLACLALCGEGNLRICYYTNWSQYRPDPAKFFPEDVDTTLCSHVIFSFANMENNRLVPWEWNDEEMWRRFNDLKLINPNLKTLLAVGGWTFDLAKMTEMLRTAQNRNIFISTSIDLLRTRGFDGLDLDFEYPGHRGSIPEDVQRFTTLVEEARAAFEQEGINTGRPPLLLAAAVGAGKDIIDTAYEIPLLAAKLDWIGLMSYDFHGGTWSQSTGHHSPLYGRSAEVGDDIYLNVEWAAQYWVDKGCPASKLVIGMPVYGRGFVLQNTGNNGFGAPHNGPSPAGPYTGEAGFQSYYECCQNIQAGAVVRRHAEHQIPWLYLGTLWMGYDDNQSLANKAKWIRNNGYAGWMVWSLDLDDFRGSFCEAGRYPLLNTLNAN